MFHKIVNSLKRCLMKGPHSLRIDRSRGKLCALPALDHMSAAFTTAPCRLCVCVCVLFWVVGSTCSHQHIYHLFSCRPPATYRSRLLPADTRCELCWAALHRLFQDREAGGEARSHRRLLLDAGARAASNSDQGDCAGERDIHRVRRDGATRLNSKQQRGRGGERRAGFSNHAWVLRELRRRAEGHREKPAVMLNPKFPGATPI